jgi:hypothetical protein
LRRSANATLFIGKVCTHAGIDWECTLRGTP